MFYTAIFHCKPVRTLKPEIFTKRSTKYGIIIFVKFLFLPVHQNNFLLWWVKMLVIVQGTLPGCTPLLPSPLAQEKFSYGVCEGKERVDLHLKFLLLSLELRHVSQIPLWINLQKQFAWLPWSVHFILNTERELRERAQSFLSFWSSKKNLP